MTLTIFMVNAFFFFFNFNVGWHLTGRTTVLFSIQSPPVHMCLKKLECLVVTGFEEHDDAQ